MLVYSMTPEEKVMELKRDYWELMIQIKAWGDAFCKEARKMLHGKTQGLQNT